jgi:Glycosyltransferase family 87
VTPRFALSAVDALLTRARVARFCWGFVIVDLILALLRLSERRIAQGRPLLPDLVAHVAGGHLLVSGQGAVLYDLAAQRAVETGITGDPSFLDLYLSPPFVAALYAPLSLLRYPVAAALWTVLSLALVAVSLWLLRECVPGVSPRDYRMLLLVVGASYPVFSLLGSGQDSGVSLLIWTAGVRLSLARRDGWAGAVFGLGAFKPQLFFLTPLVFVALGRPRALRWFLVVVAGLVVASLAVAGPGSLSAWAAILLSPAYLDGVRGGQGWQMQNLASFVGEVLPARARPLAVGAGLAASAAVIGATLLRRRATGGAAPVDEKTLWTRGCLATLLASPHLFGYDLVLLSLPAAILVEGGLERRDRVAIAMAFALTWTSPLRAVLTAPSGWPLSIVGASWTAVPLLVLWNGARNARNHRV